MASTPAPAAAAPVVRPARPSAAATSTHRPPGTAPTATVAGTSAPSGPTPPAAGDLVKQIAARDRRQALVARVSGLALGGTPLAELAAIACREAGDILQADCGVMELLTERQYRVVAGSGWIAEHTGQDRTYADAADSQARHTMDSDGIMAFDDLCAETRFAPSPFLLENGVRSGVTALIPGRGRPWGSIGLYSPTAGRFTADDAAFLAALVQVFASVVERRGMEHALGARVRQQSSLARLGREALVRGLDDLLPIVAQDVAATLEADFCKVLELDRDGRLLILRAGVGWRPGAVGQATVPADTHSQAGYALRSDGAVIVDDLATETRFEPAALLLDHGVVSGASVIVRGRDQPWGVIGVHSLHRRAFSEDDIDYLETASSLLGAAIERMHVQEELRRHRSQLEVEVAERTRQLAASNKELEAFSYSVSHDLRAPLRTITGYSTLLSSKHATQLGPESLRLLDAIHKNAERLGGLIDDLLDLSRVQQVDLVRERVDLSATCTRTLAALAAEDPGRAVTTSVQQGLVVEGDPRLLGMLMDNLLGNAWKFTRNVPAASIRVARQGTGSNAVFSVKDNGAGFDMAFANRLFQPFQRLHCASEFEGTGIGLATVKRIVDRHDGRIWAEGRPGEGATFYFTLGNRQP